MGQLDILTAQSIATERQTAVTRDVRHRQVAAGRDAVTTIGPASGRRVPALLARLGLSRQPAAA